MKKAVILLLALGLSMGLNAQEPAGEVGQVELEGVTISPLNVTYLNTVLEDGLPPSVHRLEKRAAGFNIKELDAYNGKFEAYEVNFRQKNGAIVATYDQDGQILKSFERFRNITLPPSLRNYIYQEYPGWEVSKDIYKVTYFNDKEVKKMFKIQLMREGKKHTIHLDLDDFQ